MILQNTRSFGFGDFSFYKSVYKRERVEYNEDLEEVLWEINAKCF